MAKRRTTTNRKNLDQALQQLLPAVDLSKLESLPISCKDSVISAIYRLQKQIDELTELINGEVNS